MKNNLLLPALIIGAAIVMGANALTNYFSSQESFGLKQKCHDEALKYRDDMNKNLTTSLFPPGIQPYNLKDSTYNKKLNTCLGYFEVTGFKSDLKTIYSTEEILDILHYNSLPLAIWYGDAANGHIDKGYGSEYGGKETTNYANWMTSIFQLGILP